MRLKNTVLFTVFCIQIFSLKVFAYERCVPEKLLKREAINSRSVSELDQSFFLLSASGRPVTPLEQYTAKIFHRLTGTTIAIYHPRFQRMVRLIKNNKIDEAIDLMLEEESFLNIRMRNIAAPLSSKDDKIDEPFNDMQALIIGVTRDELDARVILTGDIRYQGHGQLRLSKVSRSNNQHYLEFDERNSRMDIDLEKRNDQWESLSFGSGVFTTRAWAKAHYDAGTNRRAVQYAFRNFLCAPIVTWKQRGMPDDYVRRDVDRQPVGVLATYQNHCRNCHATMDAMGGAFAKLDFISNTFYLHSGVSPKMNQNGDFYEEGFFTTDDSWANLLQEYSGYDFGWRTKSHGMGVKAFANALANTKAYSRCWVNRVFKEICGRELGQGDKELWEELTNGFETSGYNLKKLFSSTAMLKECIAFED